MIATKRLWIFAIASTTFIFLSLAYSSLYGIPRITPLHREPRQLPIYKDLSKEKVRPPIEDNFPLLDGVTKGKLPTIPSWNRPPNPHAKEKTPLFIGFTRNWPMLQQTVLAYIAAGWPPEDIHVVDNTGTMKSNFPPNPKLTLQNPFYLNVQRLTEIFGVKVISTPTLLTFAQLQNFFIFTALENNWDYYFWGHMDVIPLTDERYDKEPFKSFYLRALDVYREVTSPDYLRNPDTGEQQDWGIQFFSYDWLALNNVKTFVKVGGWDTFVGFYTTDCDMHGRLHMAGVHSAVVDAGKVYDVGGTIDPILLFRRKTDPANPPKTIEELDKLPEDERGGAGLNKTIEAVQEQVDAKMNGKEERNSWQYKQQGGQGEPFYRDPKGFEWALQRLIQAGVDTYREKWGHISCDLSEVPLKAEDAWRVEHDF